MPLTSDPIDDGEKRSPTAGRSVFNAAFFRSFTHGDRALEAEVAGLFLAELPAIKTRISNALDTTHWLAEVHRLRGSALGIGAERLADVAKAAEGLPPEQEADRLRALADMSDEIVLVENELRALGFVAAA